MTDDINNSGSQATHGAQKRRWKNNQSSLVKRRFCPNDFLSVSKRLISHLPPTRLSCRNGVAPEKMKKWRRRHARPSMFSWNVAMAQESSRRWPDLRHPDHQLLPHLLQERTSAILGPVVHWRGGMAGLAPCWPLLWMMRRWSLLFILSPLARSRSSWWCPLVSCRLSCQVCHRRK